MEKVFTNANDKNDTNEANLKRVFNDAGTADKVEKLIDEMIDRDRKAPLAIFQLDMDKSIAIRKTGITNKLKVLNEVAELLKKFNDVKTKVIPHGSRDDITIIRERISDIDEEVKFINEVLSALREHPFGKELENGPFMISYSAGCAIYPVHGKEANVLLTLADGATRVAKKEGGDRAALADTAMSYASSGDIDRRRFDKLFEISMQTGKTIDALINEGYEELFQKHSALYRFCCQEYEGKEDE